MKMLIKIKKESKSMTFKGLNHKSQSFILLINDKMPTIIGILTFMSRINFIISRVEHEIFFITLGPASQSPITTHPLFGFFSLPEVHL